MSPYFKKHVVEPFQRFIIWETNTQYVIVYLVYNVILDTFRMYLLVVQEFIQRVRVVVRKCYRYQRGCFIVIQEGMLYLIERKYLS